MHSPIVVTVEEATKKYGRRTALDDVSLEFGLGTTVLLGRNGAGKSTLTRLIVGVETPTKGHVRLRNDQQTLAFQEHRKQVGWLPQSFGYPKRMKVAEFVRYAAWLKGVGKAEVASRVAYALEAADLTSVHDQRLGELSGGTLRRAGLAASLVHSPGVLILDEPTAGLDPIQREDFYGRIRHLSRECSLLIATHLLEDVYEVAERILVLDHGSVVWKGTVSELANRAPGQVDGLSALRTAVVALIGDAP